MRSGGAGVVIVLMVVVVMVVVDSEAWEPVVSLPEAQERLRTLQASVQRVQADARAGVAPMTTSNWGLTRGLGLRVPLSLASSLDKLRSLRGTVREKIVEQARLMSSGGYSIISLIFLAFGVILFDVLGGALLTKSAQARETVLPGLGLLGDALNNLTEVALNALTIYLYREESPDCSERLLCESSQQAGQRGLLDSLANYFSGLLVSLFLPEAPFTRSLEAMRAGRRSDDCVGLYPRCSINL